MNPRRTFQVSKEGLSLSKVRSFLTTLGIIIGVAAVIIMLAVSAGAEAEIADQINALGTNLIMVTPAMTHDLLQQARQRGAQVIDDPDFAHPFMDPSLTNHQRRMAMIQQFLLGVNPN